MLETKYFRDMNHNYLSVKVLDKQSKNSYQMKMIERNNISGLLNVCQRNIDGETYLYYEISSLQTLKSMYEFRKMDRSKTISLLCGLSKIFREIKSYLLGDNGLILKPEYIFLNWEREEVFFVFYPYGNEKSSEQLKLLLEFLVRVIDHGDEQLTDTIYDLCRLTEMKILSVDDIDRALSKLSHQQIIEMDDGSDSIFQERSSPETTDNRSLDIGTTQIDGRKQRWKFLTLTFISLAGFIFTLIYQRLLTLTPRQVLLSWVLVLAFIIFFLMTGTIYVLLVYRARSMPTPSMQNCSPLASDNQPAQYCGNTIFINEDVKEYKLYGSGRGNKYIIELTKFPFSIGKLAENNDFCLKDSSISRVHVKFTQYDEAILMTDLNSTNGTFKNGIRLDPNETVPIDAGDEVRLGKLNFYFR